MTGRHFASSQKGAIFSFSNNAIAVVFAVVFSWVLLQAVLATWGFGLVAFAAIVLVVLALAFLVILKRELVSRGLERLSNPKVLAAMALLASLALLVVSQSLSTSIVDGTWDFPYLGRDAYSIAFTGELPDGRDVYYARYPNNQLLLLLVSGLFNVVSWVNPGASVLDCHHVAIFFNAVVLIASVAILALVVSGEYGPKAAAALVLMSVLFIPFWCYSAIYYSDVIPMLFIASELAIFVRVRKTRGVKRSVLWAFLGILAGVGFELKATTIFVFMGILLFEALTVFKGDCVRKLGCVKGLGLGFMAFCLSVVVAGSIVQGALGVSDEAKEDFQFPYTHWVMMSLNETGGYNQEDVDFTKGFSGKAEKQKANIEVIKDRLCDRGFVGTVSHLLVTKVQRTWGSGCLAGDDYINRHPDHPKSLSFSLFSGVGDKHDAAKYFAQIIWLLILLLSVLEGIKAFRKKDLPTAYIAMFALVLFFLFELVWECNGRYVVHIAPLILMTAAAFIVSPFEQDALNGYSPRSL